MEARDEEIAEPIRPECERKRLFCGVQTDFHSKRVHTSAEVQFL